MLAAVGREILCYENNSKVGKVSNTSGAGNGHFRDLQTTANDVGKAEKTLFFTENAQSKVTTN